MIYLKWLKDELPLIWFCLWRQKKKEGEIGGEGERELARERQGKGGKVGANMEGERDRDRRTHLLFIIVSLKCSGCCGADTCCWHVLVTFCWHVLVTCLDVPSYPLKNQNMTHSLSLTLFLALVSSAK